MDYAEQVLTVDGCNKLVSELQHPRAEFLVRFAHLYTSIFVVFESFKCRHYSLPMRNYYSDEEEFVKDLDSFKQFSCHPQIPANDFNEVIIVGKVERRAGTLTRKEQLYSKYYDAVLESQKHHYDAELEMNDFLSLLFTPDWKIHPTLTLKTLKQYSNATKRYLMNYLIRRKALEEQIDFTHHQICLDRI